MQLVEIAQFLVLVRGGRDGARSSSYIVLVIGTMTASSAGELGIQSSNFEA